jgi:hypothetical protein
VEVPASVFRWDTFPEMVYRQNDAYSDQFTVTVTAPVEVSFASNADWEMKLTRDWFGCEVEMDSSLFTSTTVAEVTRSYYYAPNATVPTPPPTVSYNESTPPPTPSFAEHYYYYLPYRGPGFYPAHVPVTRLGKKTYEGRGAPTFYGTRDCNGPDQCVWTFTSTVPLEDVGEYLVCFRQSSSQSWTSLPASDGRKTLTIEKLTADFTYPRGIFHNQYFSALAGAAFETTTLVTGSRLEIPSSAAISISKGVCGDLSTFSFTGKLKTSKIDSSPPILDLTSVFPTVGATIAPDMGTLPSLAFNEPVKKGTGSFSLFKVGAGAATSEMTQADVVLVSGDSMLIQMNTSFPGTYYVVIETGAVLDLAGNAIPLQVLDSKYTFTVDTGAEQPAPKVLATNPAAGATAPATQVEVFFSDTIELNASATSQVEVKLGTTLVESLPSPSRPGALVASGNILTIGLDDSIVPPGGLYTISIPLGMVQNIPAAGGSVAGNPEFTFTIAKSASGYSVDKHVVFADGGQSTADGLSFSFSLSADTPP